MSTIQKTRRRRASRDTGFPEPFDLCSNTTLPHPEADLSPNACITHDEKAGEMLMTRRKRIPTGLLHRSKTRLTAASNTNTNTITITNNKNGGLADSQTDVFSNILSRSSEKESGHTTTTTTHQLQQSLTRTSSATNSSEDGNESVVAPREDELSPPTSPDSVRSVSKRNSLFSKWKR